MKRKLYIITIGVVFSISSMAWGGPNKSAAMPSALTYDRLEDVVQHGNTDQIIAVLNEAKQLRYQGEVLPFIQDLYLEKKIEHPKVNWREVSLPIVRVELANVLLQARGNGFIRFDITAMHSELRRALGSSDLEVVRKALFTLALIDDAKDVDLIFPYALQERDQFTFRTAVLALLRMCGARADAKLKELAVRVKEPESRDFIRQSAKELRDSRAIWCKNTRAYTGK